MPRRRLVGGILVKSSLAAASSDDQKMADYGAAVRVPNPLPVDNFSVRCEKYFAELTRW